MYQGPEYEDPNPPEEEVTDKAKKAPSKGGKGQPTPVIEEPVIRMIKPDPLEMKSEGGRRFCFEIGKFVKVPKIENSVEGTEVKSMEGSSHDLQEDNYLDKWVRYYFDQSKMVTPLEGVGRSVSSIGGQQEEIKEQISKAQISTNTQDKEREANASEIPSIYPEPTEDMYHYV